MFVYDIGTSEVICSQYLLDMSVLSCHPEMLVFVNETGADRRDCSRWFGYRLRCMPVVSQKLVVGGQLMSPIVGMCCDGVLDLSTVAGSVVAEDFEKFVDGCLLLQLQSSMGQLLELLSLLTMLPLKMPPFTMQSK